MFALVDPAELDVTVTYRSDPARKQHFALGSSIAIRALGVEAELPVDVFQGIARGQSHRDPRSYSKDSESQRQALRSQKHRD